MKIALVCVTNHNYGSILQTYALQEKVRSFGCDTVIIRYSEPITSKLIRCTDLEYLQTRIRMVLKQFHNRKIKGNLYLRSKAFEGFINSYLSFSESFNSLEDLSQYCHNFNLVLLGSDQVWHPMNVLMNYFTLNFVPDDIVKAAYAPSFGVKTIPHRYKQDYQQFIGRFQYISSREEQGVKLIKELTGRESQLVCDPTMLITAEEWRSKFPLKTKVNGPYVFCYFIGNHKKHREIVKLFSITNSIKTIAIIHVDQYISYDEKFYDETLYDVTPLDFLQLIDNASYIFTDSFHASLFSILFHKKFWVFDRFENNKKHSTSSRILSLLSITGLESRYVDTSDDFLPEPIIPIEFKEAERRISKIRIQSQNYLSSFLMYKDEQHK